MTTSEFKKFVDFNELEVFTSAQVGQFASQVAIDIKKSMNGELDAQSIEGSKIELASMKPVNVVDNVGGSIVKSIFYVREKQVEETIEKSENGESRKIKFLDTDLNRKLNRVGETIEKSMCGKVIKKSDELDYFIKLKKNGVSNPKEELKKSFNLDDEKADEIEKSFEDMMTPKKEEKKEGEEKESEEKDVELELESDKEVEKSIELDIIKGKAAMIGEVRVWNGKKYKKEVGGKWTEVSEKGMTKKGSSDTDSEKKENKKENFGIDQETYQKMVKKYNELSKEYTSKGVKNMMGDMFQNVSLKKIQNFIDSQSAAKTLEKSLDNMLEKINENFDKGLIDEFTYNSAGEQLATIFEKALDKSKLTKKAIVDKRGHRSFRWVRVNKEEGKEKTPKADDKGEGGKIDTTRYDKLIKRLRKVERNGDMEGEYADLREEVILEFHDLAEKVVNGMTELSDNEKKIAISSIHDDFLDGVEELTEVHFDEADIKEWALEYKDDEDSKAPEKSPEEREQFEAGDVLVDTEGTEWEIRRVDDRGYRLRGVDDTDAMGYITFNEAEEFDFVKV